jgi:hypothetical protein
VVTRQLQSDLSELEKLRGIRIVMTEDKQPLLIGLSYQKTGEKVFAWMFWTAVAVLYGAIGLIIWRVATWA